MLEFGGLWKHSNNPAPTKVEDEHYLRERDEEKEQLLDQVLSILRKEKKENVSRSLKSVWTYKFDFSIIMQRFKDLPLASSRNTMALTLRLLTEAKTATIICLTPNSKWLKALCPRYVHVRHNHTNFKLEWLTQLSVSSSRHPCHLRLWSRSMRLVWKCKAQWRFSSWSCKYMT